MAGSREELMAFVLALEEGGDQTRMGAVKAGGGRSLGMKPRKVTWQDLGPGLKSGRVVHLQTQTASSAPWRQVESDTAPPRKKM